MNKRIKIFSTAPQGEGRSVEERVNLYLQEHPRLDPVDFKTIMVEKIGGAEAHLLVLFNVLPTS